MNKLFLSFIFSFVMIFGSFASAQNVPGFLPTGTILMFPVATAPTGFLVLDGSCKTTATYKALSALLKPIYGNTGCLSTEFRLPDYRGQFVRGYDGSAGVDPDKASRTAAWSGAPSGNNVGSIQSYQIQSHFHFTYQGTSSWSGSNPMAGSNSAITPMTLATSSAGGNETRPTNITALYIIKY